MNTGDRTSVVIVGAGPVGLALGIELGLRGVPCVILERYDRIGRAPRAKTTHVRTREHLRRWGLAQELASRSPLGIHYPSDVIFVTRLGGYRLAQFHNAFNCAPDRNFLYSEHAQWIPQYTLEEVLRNRALTISNVRILFNSELLAARQEASHVDVTYRNAATNSDEHIKAQYLVGADGARSRVRSLIGARMEGTYGLSRNYNFVFRGPGLAEAHPHGPAIMYWQVNADHPSLIGPMEANDTWFFMPTRLPDGVKMTSEDAVTAIGRSTGIDLPFEVLHSDEWVASQLIADNYRNGRIFLAGDACHLHPPFGGYGMNMGIADAVDLGWKLAATLQGWGGEVLLDSYSSERRPTHQYVINEAVANHAALANSFWQEGLESGTETGATLRAAVGERIASLKGREFHNLGCVLGYRYEGSPVILDDGGAAPLLDSMLYVPSSRSGCVAPHFWFKDGTSLYDHFGVGFTLIVEADVRAGDVEQARADARGIGVPLAIIRLEPDAPAFYERAYTLIRPDQHVAWRGDSRPSRTIFETVTGRSTSQHAVHCL